MLETSGSHSTPSSVPHLAQSSQSPDTETVTALFNIINPSRYSLAVLMSFSLPLHQGVDYHDMKLSVNVRLRYMSNIEDYLPGTALR